jgi:post-segregation antitoxin (ccd killing protein)
VTELPFDIQRASLEVREHYIRMVNAGQSPRFAEMCALQQPPGTQGTDRAFMQGRLDGNWMDGLPPRMAKKMAREAKAAGINVSGKYYLGGLADKRGHMDPSAWVDSVSDIKRVAKARNLNVSGIVSVEGHEVEPVRAALNPKIVNKLAKQAMASDPKLTRQEAVRQVKEKHSPSWKRSK